MNKLRIAIIGAGPAGISCALQLNKYNIYPDIFEKDKIGGLLKNANMITNYPGFPSGINGIELSEIFYNQLSINNKIINIKVKKCFFDDNQFNIEADLKNENYDIVVCASGTKPIKFNEIDENNYIHYDISKLNELKNKEIFIIGSGDAAFDYGLSLIKDNNVTIFNRSNKIKCNYQLYRDFKNSKIQYFENNILTEINEGINKLKVKFQSNGKILEKFCDKILFAIGREPNKDFIDKSCYKSNRLYLIGDVKNGNYRQVGISVGDGILTAMKIYNNYIQKND